MEYFVLQLIFVFSFCRCLDFCMITLFLLLLLLIPRWTRDDCFYGQIHVRVRVQDGILYSVLCAISLSLSSSTYFYPIPIYSRTHYECFKVYFEYATILFMELEWHQCQLDDDCTFVAWLFLELVLPLVIHSLLNIAYFVCVAIEVSLERERERNKCSLEELPLCVITKNGVLNIYEHTLQHYISHRHFNFKHSQWWWRLLLLSLSPH